MIYLILPLISTLLFFIIRKKTSNRSQLLINIEMIGVFFLSLICLLAYKIAAYFAIFVGLFVIIDKLASYLSNELSEQLDSYTEQLELYDYQEITTYIFMVLCLLGFLIHVGDLLVMRTEGIEKTLLPYTEWVYNLPLILQI